jgi:hypothetical protein
VVKDRSTATSIPGIFAAGDAVYGTKSVVMAVASGREASAEIDRFLGGDGDISETLAPIETPVSAYLGSGSGFGYLKRAGVETVKAEDRKNNFHPVDYGIRREDICGETDRCLQCDLRLRISRPRFWADYTAVQINTPHRKQGDA